MLIHSSIKPEQEVDAGITMVGIIVEINVHSGRLKSFIAGINKFDLLIRFQYCVFLLFL